MLSQRIVVVESSGFVALTDVVLRFQFVRKWPPVPTRQRRFEKPTAFLGPSVEGLNFCLDMNSARFWLPGQIQVSRWVTPASRKALVRLGVSRAYLFHCQGVILQNPLPDE